MAEERTEKKKRAPKKGGNGKGTQQNPVGRYLRETRGELRKVTWPTPEESRRLTAIVLGVTALMAIFLGLLDFIFSNAVQELVSFVSGI